MLKYLVCIIIHIPPIEILMKFYVLFFLVEFAFANIDFKLPGVTLDSSEITQIRRAHFYIGKKLNQYEQKLTTKYSLYLAIKNYAEELETLKRKILVGLKNYILGNNNMVYGEGNVILGSNNKIAGKDNWVVSQREVSSKKLENNILYFRKWRINLDDVPYIQYRPTYVIENISQDD